MSRQQPRIEEIFAGTRLLRGDLDWIVMKALEKNRDRRYATASAFAADVERYLANDPIEASAAGLGEARPEALAPPSRRRGGACVFRHPSHRAHGRPGAGGAEGA